MRVFFGGYGIDKASVRLESTVDYKQPELSDWIRDTWAIDLPQSEPARRACWRRQNQTMALKTSREMLVFWP